MLVLKGNIMYMFCIKPRGVAIIDKCTACINVTYIPGPELMDGYIF